MLKRSRVEKGIFNVYLYTNSVSEKASSQTYTPEEVLKLSNNLENFLSRYQYNYLSVLLQEDSKSLDKNQKSLNKLLIANTKLEKRIERSLRSIAKSQEQIDADKKSIEENKAKVADLQQQINQQRSKILDLEQNETRRTNLVKVKKWNTTLLFN
jgi:chromosome segregation ATPase